jgi:hypothetical protein
MVTTLTNPRFQVVEWSSYWTSAFSLVAQVFRWQPALILDPDNTIAVLSASGWQYPSNSARRGTECFGHALPVSQSGSTGIRRTDSLPVLLLEESLFSWSSDNERVGGSASCSAEHNDGSHRPAGGEATGRESGSPQRPSQFACQTDFKREKAISRCPRCVPYVPGTALPRANGR